MSLLRSPFPPRAPRAWRSALVLVLALLASLTPRRGTAQGLGVTLQPSDLVIVAVDAGSPGERAGLRPGDRLEALAGRPVRTVEQVQQILASMRGPSSFVVLRGTQRLQGSVTLARDAAGAAAAPAAVAGDGACRPGQQVDANYAGRWYRAVVIGVREGYAPCRVHWVGYDKTNDQWVLASTLRPAGAGATQSIPGGANAYDATLDSIRGGGGRPANAARVSPGTYRCVMFVTNQLINSGEFTITGPGTYRGGDANGTYTYDAASGLVRFRGASFDGQKADYESTGRPRFQIYGPSGRRGALTCDGPPR